jgi:hypothetical protein
VSLLRVCRQIYHEALTLLYTTNNKINLGDCSYLNLFTTIPAPMKFCHEVGCFHTQKSQPSKRCIGFQGSLTSLKRTLSSHRASHLTDASNSMIKGGVQIKTLIFDISHGGFGLGCLARCFIASKIHGVQRFTLKVWGSRMNHRYVKNWMRSKDSLDLLEFFGLGPRPGKVKEVFRET